MAVRAPKNRNVGRADLIPRTDWVPRSQIQGCDRGVLVHPLFETAFDAMVRLHRPTKPIALVSLCTVTRPYTVGRKWKTLAKYFGSTCDLVVNSNGGVIPIQFELSYPFLTYDAHGEPENDELYNATLTRRNLTFFRAHRYDYIMWLFRPNLRNSRYAHEVGATLKTEGCLKDYAVMPDEGAYRQAQADRFAGGYRMYPEIYPPVLQTVYDRIKSWTA